MNDPTAAIRRDVLADIRAHVRAYNPDSYVLGLIDQVEARWKEEGKLERVPDVEDGTV